MVFYFTGIILMSTALITLGKYAAVIAMIATATKVTFGLLAVVAAALLWRKFRGKPRINKPQALGHRR